MSVKNSKPGKPTAPAPYRPQPVPKVLQRKVAGPPVSKPAAPPVYRPQSTPVVLQRKVRPELQPRTPVTAPSPHLNNTRANTAVAQRKTNSVQQKLVINRPPVMTTPRGIQLRGTVQRAALEVKAPAIRWFFDGVPEPVQRTLQTMLVRVPLFKTLCESVMAQFHVVNVSTMPAVKGMPRAHYKNGVVYVNSDMNHDDMVNSIVFELTNAMHSQSLGMALEIEDPKQRAASIEYNEYHGVMIQSEIIKAAKEASLVEKEMFGGKWKSFEEYAEAQKASGHTGLYEKPASGDKCFITSACVFARGLPDDCDELTTLRAFRDNYIMNAPGGPELIREYYEVAPGIVERIYGDKESERILASLYEELVVPSVNLILNGEFQNALLHYRTWVARLLCLESQTSLLDTVSTVRGSGWVHTQAGLLRQSGTHPLPRTVLTVSKSG